MTFDYIIVKHYSKYSAYYNILVHQKDRQRYLLIKFQERIAGILPPYGIKENN